jgi:ribosomal peptide maturation radical SAM protein 1
MGRPRIAFVQMPWASPARPSIAIGILASICREVGVEHEALYLNIDTACAVGIEVAERFASSRHLFGFSEHLFAVDLFGAAALHSDELLEDMAGQADLAVSSLQRLRDRTIPALLSVMEERVLACEPTVVGFGAMFNQVMPILALAARLKRRRPDLLVICGGACFDGEMGQEYHRALPEVIDHVFLAEAEASFRTFLHRLQAGERAATIPGVTWWQDGRVNLVPGEPLRDMNESPTPEYDSYFAERARAEREYGVRLELDRLPFESSRGCWWGEKNHCVFCGLNPAVLPFRPKSIERTVSEIVTLAERHRVTRLIATDWIVSREQRAEIFRRLQERGLDLDIFYETRADMSKEEITLMKAAGVHRAQPGIESFSTPLLRYMRKHSQGIRQIQFLRWCREARVHPAYHLLAGFPGEDPAWFAEMSELIPHLVHLDPPQHNVFTVEMHRFSPLFNLREQYGVVDYDVRADYQFNFPDGLVDRRKTGYFFEFTSRRLPDPDPYLAPLREVVQAWILAHREPHPPSYTYHLGPGFVRVVDHRGPGRPERSLGGLARDVLLLCDEVKSKGSLRSDLVPVHGGAVGRGQLDAEIRWLVDEGILLEEGELLLTLPISAQPRSTATLRQLVLGAQGRSEGTSRLVALPA